MLRKLRPVYKYFFVTLLLAAIVLNLFYAVNYAYTEREILKRENQTSLRQTVYYFDRYMHEIEDISNSIAISSKVQDLFKTASNKGYINYYSYRDCKNYLSEFTLPIVKLYRIDLYVDRHSSLITSDTGVYYNMMHEKGDEAEYANTLSQKKPETLWLQKYNEILPSSIRKYREGDVLTLQKPLYSIYNGKKEGVLFMHVLLSDLEQLIDFEDGNSFTEVVGKNGNSIIEGEQREYYSYHIVEDRSDYSGFLFTKYYQEPSFLGYMEQTTAVSLLLILFFGIVFWVLIRISEKRMFYPVATLLSGFAELEKGDFSYRLDEKRSDMFGKIFQHFNQMSERLEKLMLALSKERLQRNEFKYQLLQMQIKPHFLYNLFNNMIWLAAQREYESLERFVTATAGYYKTALNQGEQDITLGQNRKQLEYYAEIQRMRFHEDVELDFDFPEEVLGDRIPNLLLQPLVENSIVHGIRETEPYMQMHIRISARRYPENLYLEVWDNGRGIPRMVLEDIQKELKNYSVDGSKYFALVNVVGRLANRYHDKAAFEIDSIENKWTKVTITIPVQEREDVSTDNSR